MPVALDEWEEEVEEMGGSLDEGWEPPPLLAGVSRWLIVPTGWQSPGRGTRGGAQKR